MAAGPRNSRELARSDSSSEAASPRATSDRQSMPRVVVDLKIKPASGTACSVEGQASARVLLVEDHADTLRTLKRLLVSLGHCVTTADGIAAAVAEADAADERVRRTGSAQGGGSSVEPFDILVSDIGLHDGSG